MPLRLDRLISFNAQRFPTLFQRHCEAIEANAAAQDTINADLASQLAQIIAAQAAADAVKTTDKISGSSIVPAEVLTATDAGANATVTVAAHTRVYGDGAQLSVGGHSFTAKAYSTKYAVYYDDTTCADTTPTYHITTTLSNAVANFASGRHFVGIVTTPASGGGATTGGASAPGTDPADKPDFSSL